MDYIVIREQSFQELYHHGISGQRWGIRRFQNPDGTWTAEGKKRYGYDSGDSNKKTRYEKQYERREQRDNKYREKLANTTHKSKMRLRSEERYKAMGMSDKEAELAAYKRARAQKIGLAVGAVAVTAAAAWVAKNHYDKITDGYIKDGTVLKRIQIGEDAPIRDGLFFSYTKKDVDRYAGMYGPAMAAKKGRDAPVFQIGRQVQNGGIKVASMETQRKVIEDLTKNDPEFREQFMASLEKRRHWHLAEEGTYRKALQDYKAGKVTDAVANAQNFNYNFHESEHQKVHDRLFGEMRSRGYGALYDVHDQKFSGFHTEKPIIFFDKGGKLHNMPAKELNESWMNKQKYKHLVLSNIENVADWIPPVFAAGSAGVGVATMVSSRKNRKIIKDYLAEHPNSKLTNNEILRMEQESRRTAKHNDMDDLELYHYGISGQKWGTRRYQNEDGTRTEAGKARYYTGSAQRKDRKMYGKRAVKRIKKEIRKGASLEEARGGETERLYDARSRAKVAGILGAIGGAAIGTLTPVMLQRGSEAVDALWNIPGLSEHKYMFYRPMVTKAAAGIGAMVGAKAGYTLSRNLAMNVQGYKAKRYKDM